LNQDEVSAAVQRFKGESDLWSAVAESVRDRVQSIADKSGIRCRVSGRAKDIRSFHKKIAIKQYSNPWAAVTDKAGVRAVVDTPQEVDLLQRIVADDFQQDLLETDDKRIVTDPAKLNYSGIHLQVQVQHPSSSSGPPLECEVQLRTAAQDLWAVMSHRMLYKPVLDLPSDLQHAAYRLVSLVEMYDEEVQRLTNALPTLVGHDVVDLLEIAETLYLRLAHSPSNRELGVQVLRVVEPSISSDERGDYASVLRAFVDADQDKLETLYLEYGPHSEVNYLPSYMLFGQAESLIILERLSIKPHSLTAAWDQSSFPRSYLESLAAVAGIDLPESV
jgi:ppGpp synthetase/RelA/SpoT-type nucleotidyltranferase